MTEFLGVVGFLWVFAVILGAVIYGTDGGTAQARAFFATVLLGWLVIPALVVAAVFFGYRFVRNAIHDALRDDVRPWWKLWD